MLGQVTPGSYRDAGETDWADLAPLQVDYIVTDSGKHASHLSVSPLCDGQ